MIKRITKTEYDHLSARSCVVIPAPTIRRDTSCPVTTLPKNVMSIIANIDILKSAALAYQSGLAEPRIPSPNFNSESWKQIIHDINLK